MFSNKNSISFSYLCFPWLHRIKSKLLKKEQKVFYEASCFFSLLSTPTSPCSPDLPNFSSVIAHFPTPAVYSIWNDFPHFIRYTLCSSLKLSSRHLQKAFLDFPKIHSPHADFTLYIPLLGHLSLCIVIMSVSSSLTRLWGPWGRAVSYSSLYPQCLAHMKCRKVISRPRGN